MVISVVPPPISTNAMPASFSSCLLYTSDAADERSSVDLGGRRIIKKKKNYTRGLIEIIADRAIESDEIRLMQQTYN